MLHDSEKDFIKRHIGTSEEEQSKMLKVLGYTSLHELISKTVPEKILFTEDLDNWRTKFWIWSVKKVKKFIKKKYYIF